MDSEILTLLLVDLLLNVEIDCNNDQVGDNIKSSHAHQDLGIFKGNLLGDLHRPQDDDEVGTVLKLCQHVKDLVVA